MRISGNLDLCGPSLIEGWLYCDAWHGEAIRLQVYVEGELIGECAVDRFRQDLQEAGYGDGRCGFSFPVPEKLQLSSFADARLRLIDSPIYLLPNDSTVFAAPIAAEPKFGHPDDSQQPQSSEAEFANSFTSSEKHRKTGAHGREGSPIKV